MIHKLGIATILLAISFTNVHASDTTSITFYDAFQDGTALYTLFGGESVAFEFTSLATGSVSDIKLNLDFYNNPLTVTLSFYRVTSNIAIPVGGANYNNLRGTEVYTTSPITFTATGNIKTTANFPTTGLSLKADTNYYVQINHTTPFNGNNLYPNNLGVFLSSTLPQIKFVGNPIDIVNQDALIYRYQDPDYYATMWPPEMLITGIAPVPVPSTIWLFGSALVGIIGFNRRKTIP